ncbi:hypothetical protein KUTeg_020972 [Tegillarca granosa]|uniref:non-specific serine/threonine protein kinase n=1 Tax=Tegillarca granosa TaxID=220873 RepID=A0ABQ9E9Z4_TEGGR|nr:hypothetical protein KUTeg_020972 [Tegillarca granosa]
MAQSQELPRTCGCYTLTESIGKGTYGSVFKAKPGSSLGGLHASQGEVVAIKIIKYQGANKKEKDYALREVEVLKECDHMNVVSYLNSFFEEGMSNFCIVMEFCKNNLRDFIRQQEQPMSEETFINLFLQLCNGVEYLHSKDIIHRDLKPTNVLLTNDNTVKIADFGVARVVDLVMFSSLSIVGTHRYMSPEMHQIKDYDDKTDIWSLGCTAYEMATKEPAYTTTSIVELKNQLGVEQLPNFEKIPYCISIKELIKSMMNISSPRRPKASSLVKTLSGHQPCKKEKKRRSSSQHQNIALDSGYGAESSGSIKAPRSRFPSESDKFCSEVSTDIQSKLVKILEGAEPVAEILRILRTETDKKARRKAIKAVTGSKYEEIRPLVRSLRPVVDQLSRSSDFSTDSSVTSQSSTESI